MSCKLEPHSRTLPRTQEKLRAQGGNYARARKAGRGLSSLNHPDRISRTWMTTAAGSARLSGRVIGDAIMLAKPGVCFALPILLLTTLLFAAPATAGSLQVDPILLEISQSRRTTMLRIANREAVPVTIRVHAMSWSQPAGADLYQDT